jgi:predicted nucleotidyltransferase
MDSGLLSKLIAFFDRDEEKENFQLVYFWGSRATGQAAAGSDYDFAILFSVEAGFGKVCALEHRLAEFLDTDQIDLIALNHAPVELQYNVVATGKLIYGKSTATRVEFEAETLSLYFDLLPLLRRHRQELLQESNYETGIRRYRATLGKTQELLDQIRTS